MQGYLLVYSADVFPELFELFVGILNSADQLRRSCMIQRWYDELARTWKEMVDCFKVLL